MILNIEIIREGQLIENGLTELGTTYELNKLMIRTLDAIKEPTTEISRADAYSVLIAADKNFYSLAVDPLDQLDNREAEDFRLTFDLTNKTVQFNDFEPTDMKKLGKEIESWR